jgi:hypothetical protein
MRLEEGHLQLSRVPVPIQEEQFWRIRLMRRKFQLVAGR